MVGGNRVDDLFVFVVFAEHVGTDLGMGTFDFMVDGFAQIVEKTDTFGAFLIQTQFSGDDTHEIGGFQRVLKHILREAVTILQSAQQTDDGRGDALNTGFKNGGFALLKEFIFNFLADLFGKFFDAGGVDPAVADQALHQAARHLFADRVKTADDHRFGGVVNKDTHTGDSLNGADIASFAADDPALHFIVGQGDRGGGTFIGAV